MIRFTFHRFKHQALSNRICGQLVRFPSLGLGRGVRCGQIIHGRLVMSFTVQKSFVKHIRVSELHLTACSLMDALLTSSLPCASVSRCVAPVPPPQFTPRCPSPVFLRQVAHLSESLAKAVSSIRLPALPHPAAVSDKYECYSMCPCNGTVPYFPHSADSPLSVMHF